MEPGAAPNSLHKENGPTSLSKRGFMAFVKDCCYGECDVMLGLFCVKRTYVNELWRIFKYGVVGVLCLGIHVGLYHWMSRVAWESGNRTVQYVLALTVSAVVNFTLHRLWTFAVSTFHFAMILRYIGVIGWSMSMQSLVFHIFVDTLHFYDYVGFVVASVAAVFFQYLLHRLFTFKERRKAGQ